MVCFLPQLVAPAPVAGEEKQIATVSHVADHILYVGKRIGLAHVGIGSDFDGMLHGPQDLDDVSQYPNLVAELLRRGVSDDQIQNILGLNVLRVLQGVEDTARQIRLCESITVQCDEIAAIWTPEQESWIRQAGESRVRKKE
jgi:Zn-dependent dipeptidase, microsomal dipeptidase homolog